MDLNSINVLAVDDSISILEIIKDSLSNKGMNVLTAMNGLEALDIVCSKPVDILILDIQMPVMNGFQLCRLMKNDMRLKEIPIVLLTSRPAEEDKNRIWGFRAGADAYINKVPFYEDILISTIESLLQDGKH